MKKISVLIITYNHERFIAETLTSVVSQDYPSFEVVIADDASSDRNQEIIRTFQSRYPHLIVPILNTRNIGITKNCNVALAACSGDFVAIMGGDDLMLPGKLAAQAREFERNPDAVLCYHPVDVFDSATDQTLFVANLDSSLDVHNVNEMIEKGGVANSCVMVRRSASPVGGFDERLPVISDWLYYIEVAMRGRVVKVDQTLSRYRKHSGGVTQHTLMILDEALRQLDIVVEKYPERVDIRHSCRLGKARYLAGEAFRQIAGAPEVACRLMRKARQFDPANRRYRLLSLLLNIPLCRPFLPWLTPQMGYRLKRVFGSCFQ